MRVWNRGRRVRGRQRERGADAYVRWPGSGAGRCGLRAQQAGTPARNARSGILAHEGRIGELLQGQAVRVHGAGDCGGGRYDAAHSSLPR